MQHTFLITGLACLMAAIVGGGLKAFGIEIPLLNSRIRQTILGLLGIVLIAAGFVLYPALPIDSGNSNQSTKQQVPTPPLSRDRGSSDRAGVQERITGGTIIVRCTANPHATPVGGQVEIRVLALTEQNSPLPNANVKIESGGGWFSTSGTSTEVGNTDLGGIFATHWLSPKPAAAAYVMGVNVNKEGFAEGYEECRVPIH